MPKFCSCCYKSVFPPFYELPILLEGENSGIYPLLCVVLGEVAFASLTGELRFVLFEGLSEFWSPAAGISRGT